jgi:hypothetical protein
MCLQCIRVLLGEDPVAMNAHYQDYAPCGPEEKPSNQGGGGSSTRVSPQVRQMDVHQSKITWHNNLLVSLFFCLVPLFMQARHAIMSALRAHSPYWQSVRSMLSLAERLFLDPQQSSNGHHCPPHLGRDENLPGPLSGFAVRPAHHGPCA